MFWGCPPPPHDYPYYWVILDPKSKEDKSNFEFCKKLDTPHTFWSCSIRCANMKWIPWVLLKIQSGHDSVHRWKDRRTDGQGETSIPPFNFIEAGDITRTTRTLAFWGYPLLPHDYPYYWPVHIESQVKTRQSQSYKFKEFSKTSKLKTSKFLILKMCKYEMDPGSIVEHTEWTWFCPQTDIS